MTLTRDEIIAAIAARKVETTTVEVPEWGGAVQLRRMDAADLEAIGLMSGEPTDDMPVRVLAACICDDEGNPLFGVKKLKELEAADAVVVLRLFAECAKLNGLMTAELEEMVAGFGAAQPGASSSS
jgi:hypothetical protein